MGRLAPAPGSPSSPVPMAQTGSYATTSPRNPTAVDVGQRTGHLGIAGPLRSCSALRSPSSFTDAQE